MGKSAMFQKYTPSYHVYFHVGHDVCNISVLVIGSIEAPIAAHALATENANLPQICL